MLYRCEWLIAASVSAIVRHCFLAQQRQPLYPPSIQACTLSSMYAGLLFLSLPPFPAFLTPSSPSIPYLSHLAPWYPLPVFLLSPFLSPPTGTNANSILRMQTSHVHSSMQRKPQQQFRPMYRVGLCRTATRNAHTDHWKQCLTSENRFPTAIHRRISNGIRLLINAAFRCRRSRKTESYTGRSHEIVIVRQVLIDFERHAKKSARPEVDLDNSWSRKSMSPNTQGLRKRPNCVFYAITNI